MERLKYVYSGELFAYYQHLLAFDAHSTCASVFGLKTTVQTDLDRLIYAMKTTHEETKPTQYPAFWNEEWLKRAIDELDTRKMTPEERAYFARVTAANAEAVKAEKQKIQEARGAENVAVKTEVITKALKRGKLTIEEIAEDSSVSINFVHEIQRGLGQNQ